MNSSEHCTITATLPRFSYCDVEYCGSTEYECDNHHFKDWFEATFYANGSCVENEGHVSIVFNANGSFNFIKKRVTLSCVASVIDSSGNKRFPQSLAFDLDDLYKEDIYFCTNKGFGFDKFVKRSTLLNDSPELLPDDCLTLCLDIDYEVIFSNDAFNSRMYNAYDALVLETQSYDRCYLRLDSEFGRELCRMSTVFRDMMECTTVQSGLDLIPLSLTEYRNFQFIYCSLVGLGFKSTLSGICKLYALADKYDMQPVVELCHQLLLSVLRAMNTREKMECVDKNMHWISDLAERFEEDKNLREILAIYSELKNKNEGRRGELYVSYSSNLETKWKCEYIRQTRRSLRYLWFSKEGNEHLEIGIYK